MALTKIKETGIADDAITAGKIASGAVVADITSGSVTATHLAGSIPLSKTNLTAGNGISLATDTVSVSSTLSHVTGVGTLTGLTVNSNLLTLSHDSLDTRLKIEATANNRAGILQILGGSSDKVAIDFGQSGGTGDLGRIRYDISANTMNFINGDHDAPELILSTSSATFAGVTTKLSNANAQLWVGEGNGNTDIYMSKGATGDDNEIRFSKNSTGNLDIISEEGLIHLNKTGYAYIKSTGIGTSDGNARTLILGGRPSDSNYVTLGFDSGKTYRGSWDFEAHTGKMSCWIYSGSWKEYFSIADDGQTNILNASTAQLRIKSTSAGDGILDLQAGGANDTQVRFYEDSTFKWRLRNNAGGSYRMEIINASDVGVSLGYGGNTWGTQSDERIKENLIEITGATEKLNQLRCVNYNYTFDKEREHLGLIAQEVQKIYPEIVDGDPSKEIEETINEDGIVERKNIMSIEYSSLIPVLVKSIQELSAEVKKLKEG